MSRQQSIGAWIRRYWWTEGGLLIPLAAVVACLPLMVRGVTCGHDFDFHLLNWMEIQRAWHEHLLWPHWAETPNWGTGEPRFVFYPPVSWILGALLGTVFGWQWAAGVFTWLCFAASGFTTRALARRLLPAANATLAGVLATAAPYALFVAYERTAYSELAAAALIPLILLFALRRDHAGEAFFRVASSGAWRLALTLALIWLTNAPAGVMASYLLVFTAIMASWLQRSWMPALRALIAAPVALGMAAIYLVPAAWEQRWIAVNQALDVGMRVSDSWLFARHPWSADMKLHDEILLTASIILLATAIAAFAGFMIRLSNKRLYRSTKTIWIPLAVLIVLVLAVQFPFTTPFWHLPKMEFLQFPWRWMIVLDVPFAVFVAGAVPISGAKLRRHQWLSVAASAALLLLFTGIAERYFFQTCDDEDSPAGQQAVFREGSGVEGTDEYAPTGADNSLVTDNLPDACLVTDATREIGDTSSGKSASPEWYAELGTCDATFNATLWQTEHKHFSIISDDDGYLVLRLRRYPAWHISINGVDTQSLTSRDDGLMTLPIHEGASTIDISWADTEDQRIGREISAVSLVLFAGLAAFGLGKRRVSRHLS